MAAQWADEYLTMISDCEKRESQLSEWEIAFINSLQFRIEKRGRAPTPPQVAKLNDIWERVTRNG